MTKEIAIEEFKKTWILTNEMRLVLRREWVINWVGTADFNISNIVRANIVFLPNFEAEKLSSFLDTVELKLSNPHDVRFYIWWWLYKFIKANFIFAKDLYKILHWTSKYEKITLCVVVFLILIKFWRKYFNFK